MSPSPNLWLAAVPGVGMVLVAIAALALWKRTSRVGLSWLWIGVALWTVAMAVAVAIEVALDYGINPSLVAGG